MLAEELRGLTSLGHDAVVITAGQRLARAARRYIEQARLDTFDSAWREPEVVTFDSWLRASFRQCALRSRVAMPHLLSSAQATAVWRDCCVEQINAAELEVAGITAMAQECQRAFQLMQSWQLDDAVLDTLTADDNALFFARCLAGFRARQEREHWISESEIGAVLIEHRDALDTLLPTTRWFAGFSQLTPLQRALMERFSIEFRRTAVGAAHDVRSPVLCFDAPEDELIAAGRWAREHLQRAPEARLAIVTTNLDQGLAQKRRRVLEGLDPNALGTEGDIGIEVSVAQPLLHYPAIDVAMCLLRWATRAQRFTVLSRVLRAPWLGDQIANLEAEMSLRERPDQQWSVPMFAEWLQNHSSAPAWLAAVVALHEQRQQVCSCALWAERFGQTFEAIGWLRDSAPDSAAFQLLNAFYEQLNSLASMDSVLPPTNLGGAVAALQRLIGDTLFQPQAQYEHVLLCGPLELAGLQLDGIWIAGCSATQWPPAGQPATLLPAALQRECQMPDASAEQTQAFWQRQFRLLMSSAASCCVSYAEREGDSELLPSPLISEWPTTTGAMQRRGLSGLVGSASIKVDVDDVGVFDSSRTLKGGFNALGRQSTDPFGAMIAGRWRPRILREPAVGIDAALRGSLIHKSLEVFYQRHTSQDDIAAMDEDTRADYCASATAAAFAGRFVSIDQLTRLLLRREEQRTRDLVAAFVSDELQRDPFSVQAVESSVTVTLAGLKVDIRIDRIDTTAEGRIIIDYKTGRPGSLIKPAQFAEQFPQLACYLIGVPEPVQGIALAWINPSMPGWHALGEPTLALPNGKVTHLNGETMDDVRLASLD
ncbi:MAG: PD-(D/E)XK nuclease family protein, partial [Pseudomonadota bacterium]